MRKQGIERTWQHWLLGALLIVAAIAVEWPALHGVYQWDDDTHVWSNPNLRDTTGLVRTWTDPFSNLQYYPLTITAFWIEYRMWGVANTAGFHLVNMLVHGVNCLLVWLVLRRLGVGWPFVVALLFAVHPMVVDSVAWISELKNLLSGMFYLLGILAWIRWSDTADKRQWWWYAAMLAAFIAGILSKAVVCTFPVAVLLLEYWRTSRITRRSLLAMIPFVAIAGAMGLLFAQVEKVNVGAAGAAFNFTVIDRILIAGRAIVFYVTKLLVPLDLLAIYPRWRIDPRDGWQWIYPLAVLAAFAALWFTRKRIGRGPLIAAALYVVTLAPALGFVNFFPMRLSFVADHYAYLAMIPLLVLVLSAIRHLVPRWDHITRFDRRQVVFLLAACAALVPLTVAQAALWQTEVSLWEHTVIGNPDDWTSRANLAWGYYSQGRLEEARHQAEKSLAINPENSRPHYTLGMIYLQQGRSGDAIREFSAGLDKEPRSPLLWQQFGAALEQAGLRWPAEAAYRRAIGLDPQQVRAWNNLASLLLRREEYATAEEAARNAVARAPGYAMAHVNLGFALGKLGKYDQAAAELRTGLALMPENPRVRHELARMLLKSGDISSAIAEYRRVLAEMPDPAIKAEFDRVIQSLNR